MRFTFIILFFSSAVHFNLLAQSNENLTDSKLPRFEALYHTIKSEAQTIERNGQVYKVMKDNVLDAFWRTVQDSLMKQHQQLVTVNAKLKTMGMQKTATEKLLAIQKASMQEVVFDSNHITLLGIPFSKGLFIFLFTALVGTLGFSLCVALARMRYAITVMKENAQVLHYLSTDYEEFKRKSLERQVRLSRQLQDERNKVRNSDVVANGH